MTELPVGPTKRALPSPPPPPPHTRHETQDLLPIVQRQTEILSNKVRHWSARSEPVVFLCAGVGHEEAKGGHCHFHLRS